MLSMIVARGHLGAIGAKGDLPWHISEDLQYFKKVTLGKPVIMGRKTYESIGRPLPNRRNIVISRQAAFAASGVEVFGSLEAALEAASSVPELMVIGGGTLYEAALAAADRLYITEVDKHVPGADAFFPNIREEDWVETRADVLDASETRPRLVFRVLDRR